jgi:hypothetical protein
MARVVEEAGVVALVRLEQMQRRAKDLSSQAVPGTCPIHRHERVAPGER